MSDKTTKLPMSLRLDAGGQGALKVALGLSAAMLIPGHALAQAVTELAPVVVEETAIDPNPNAEVGVPYKARTSGDVRITRPLAEVPATIAVLTKDQINDSGFTDLREILDAQPGITVGTGENGNAFGDRYVIRGQEARSDVFVDGLRDPGMTMRESFAIEQLEISKGPNSSFAGRGTAGGAVNAITKQATTSYNFGRLDVAGGTDKHSRTSLDVNHSFGDLAAVRANLMYTAEDVPDRAPAERERKGAALSVHLVPTDKLDVTLDYYGFEGHDNPDVGSYLVNRKPAANPPVYAQAEDFLDSKVETSTARVKYSFTDNLRLTNLTRYGTSKNGYFITGGRQANTSPNGPGGSYVTTTTSNHQGWQEVEYLANQTNLAADVTLFGREHNFIFGVEYTDHKVLNGVYTSTNGGAFNCATGTSAVLNNYCIVGPNGLPVANANTLIQRTITKDRWDIDWNVETASYYVMDTVDLTDRLTLFAGARADDFKYKFITQSGALVQTAYSYSDTLYNGHIGLTYDVGNGGIVYASVASSSDINGGESDVGTNSGYGGVILVGGAIPDAEPETSINVELGTKWNLFNEKLLFTAAAFETVKDDVFEGAGYAAIGTPNSGKNRVRGVEFGLTGNLTDKLMVQGGVAYMHSRVLESATAANVGRIVSNFAGVSGVLQAKYQFTEDFYFGGSIKHEGERYGGQPDTSAAYSVDRYSQVVPAYTVFDLFAGYHVNKNVEARLNVGNVTDKDYYLAVYQAGFFLYKGDARKARLTLTYEF